MILRQAECDGVEQTQESVSMETDIYQKMELDFGAELPRALEQLDLLDARTKGYSSLLYGRYLRAVVFLAEGDVREFERMLGEMAGKDSILRQAECDGGEVQVRDFEKTFHALGLMGK